MCDNVSAAFDEKNSPATEQGKNWTVIYYAAGCNSSEEDLMPDMEEIKKSFPKEMSLVILIDRVEGFSDDAAVFGDDFTDTRLYTLNNGKYERLSGNEMFPLITPTSVIDLNMGNAGTLKRTIQYAKKYYPAKNYALFIRSHGDGISTCRDIEQNRDAIYIAELTDSLTESESVDLLALDVCSMAGIEVMQQLAPKKDKFSVDYLIASAPTSQSFNYSNIFNRISTQQGKNNEEDYFSGSKEKYYSPLTLTPLEFGKVLIEEIRDQQDWCSWGLFDLDKIGAIKQDFDKLLCLIKSNNQQPQLLKARDTTQFYYQFRNVNTETLNYYKMRNPYFDFYDLLDHFKNTQTNSEIVKQIEIVQADIQSIIIHSYSDTQGRYLNPFPGFKEGKNGIYIFFSYGGSDWQEQETFYTAEETLLSKNEYGKLAWLLVNENSECNMNWFSFQKSLFDSPPVKEDKN